MRESGARREGLAVLCAVGLTALALTGSAAVATVGQPSPSDIRKFHRAASKGDAQTLEVMVKAGHPVDARSTSGQTALFFACWRGKLEAARWLVAQGASVNAVGLDGRSPLWVAVAFSAPDLVEFLLSKGADPNPVNRESGTSALLLAVRSKEDTLAALLAEYGADPRLEAKDGISALDEARRRRDRSLAEVLSSPRRKREAPMQTAKSLGKDSVSLSGTPERELVGRINRTKKGSLNVLAGLLVEGMGRRRVLEEASAYDALAGLPAEEIGVSTRVIAHARSLSSPGFSSLGDRLAYLREEGGSVSLEVVSLPEARRLYSIELPTLSTPNSWVSLGWSMDDRKVIVVARRSHAAVVRLDAQDVTAVSIARLSCNKCTVSWRAEWEVDIAAHQTFSTADLETLQSTGPSSESTRRSLSHRLLDARTVGTHAFAFLENAGADGFFLRSKFSNYSRRLFESGEKGWAITGDLSYFAMVDGESPVDVGVGRATDELILGRLGRRAVPELMFVVDADKGSLTSEQIEEVDVFLDEGVRVFAEIFSERLNPLTGRPIGHKGKLRGVVELLKRNGLTWEARLVSELDAPLGASGPTIGSIFSLSRSRSNSQLNISGESLWVPLRAASGSPIAAITPHNVLYEPLDER